MNTIYELEEEYLISRQLKQKDESSSEEEEKDESNQQGEPNF